MMTVDLVRHGETVARGRLLGRTDAPLTDQGLAQVVGQAGRRRWRTLVTSPLGRARLGAERVAASGDVTLIVDDGWAEMDFGAWDGKLSDELRADPAVRGEFDRFLSNPETATPPGGETWGDFTTRLTLALDRLAAYRTGSGAEVEPIGVMTHAGVIRGVLAVTCGLGFEELWRLRIGYGTRVTLGWGRDGEGGLWGEIIEVVQP